MRQEDASGDKGDSVEGRVGRALRSGWSTYRWWVLLALGATSLVLGYIGWGQLFERDDAEHGVLSRVYYAIGLFAPDGAREPEPLPLALQVARFTAPATLAAAAIGAFTRLFRRESTLLWRSLAYRRPLVVVGTSPLGAKLVEEAERDGEPCFLVEPVPAGGAPVTDALRTPVVRLQLPAAGPPTDDELRRALVRAKVPTARLVVITTGDDALNARIATAAAALLPVRDGNRPAGVAATAQAMVDGALPTLLVEVAELQTLEAVRNELPPPSASAIDYFNLAERSAREVLVQLGSAATARPDLRNGRPPHLVVHGSGALALSLAVQAARFWAVDALRTDDGADLGWADGEVTLVLPEGEAPDDLAPQVASLHADLRPVGTGGRLRVVGSSDQAHGAAPATAVIVALDDEIAAVVTGRSLVAAPERGSAPLWVVVERSGGIADLALRDHAHVFGVVDAAWSSRVLRFGLAEDVARAVQALDHRRRQARAGDEDTANRVWAALSPGKRALNRAAVQAAREGLDRCGYALVRQVDPRAAEWTIPDVHVDRLAEHLHEWWRAAVTASRERAATGSAHLVPWAELDQVIAKETEAAAAAGRIPPPDWNRQAAREVAQWFAAVGLEVRPRVAVAGAGLDDLPFSDNEVEVLAQAYAEVGRPARQRRPTPATDADRASARALPHHVRALGLRLVPGGAGTRPIALDPALVEAAARDEHDRWAAYVRSRGYVVGSPRRDDGDPPVHPNLVPWAELDEETRQKDRDRILAIPAVLAAAGFDLVPLSEREAFEETENAMLGVVAAAGFDLVLLSGPEASESPTDAT